MRFCLPLIGLLMLCMEVYAMEMEKAGTTVANAPYIVDTTALSVQSGSNYIRFDEERLPAVVTYIPSAPFGTIPAALTAGDTIDAEMVFADCGMAWRWAIEKSGSDKIVEIKAHESASILAVPHTCAPTYGDTTAVACDSLLWKDEWRYASGDYEYLTTNAAGCDSIVTLRLTIHHATTGDTTATACEMFVWHGTTYTESAETTYTLTNAVGCDSIVTLHLTIEHNCIIYDTTAVYFCRGFNSEHYEPMPGGVIHHYLPYAFESPAEWDFMESVILENRQDSTLLDLRRAETNLYEHYVGDLTPVTSIRWSVLYDGKGKYVPLTVTEEPQWVATGYVAIQVNFLCGELYNTEFPTDIDHVSMESVSIKRIENGRVVILRGGEKYDIFGTKIQ